MALSVDFTTRVISVPQADLTPLGGGLYELDTNIFRLNLKDWEDNEDPIFMPDTHSHNTTVLLGGIEYARIIEIINGYTITFEDGQYAVNLVGSNNNIADVTNINQVSVRPNNSAGLIQTREIQHAAFNGGVTIAALTGTAGTYYPIGTTREPVNNYVDAQFIATLYGFNTYYVIENLTLDTGDDASGYIFEGTSPAKTTLTLNSGADTTNVEVYFAHVAGILDGGALLSRCLVTGLQYFNGFLEQCMLGLGDIVLGGGVQADMLDCWSAIAGTGTPTIDLGGAGQALTLRNYSGGIKLKNKTGTESVSVDLISGQIVLDTTITNGTIVARGTGKLIDTNGDHILSGTWNGGVTIINETVNPHSVAHATWDEELTEHQVVGTAGEKLDSLSASGSVTPADIDAIVAGVWDELLAGHSIVGSAGEQLGAIDTSAIPLVPTKEEISDAVWDEILANHLSVGSTGEKLNSTTEVSDIPTPPTVDEIADQVWEEEIVGHVTVGTMGRELSDTAKTSELPSVPTPPTADEIADQVWDEAEVDHVTAGSFGAKVGGLPDVTITIQDIIDIADQVWDEILTGHTDAGSAGEQLSAIDTSPIPIPPTIGEISDAVWTEILADHSSVVGSTAEKLASLENATPTDITAIVDAVWSENLSIYDTLNTAGNILRETGHIRKAVFVDTDAGANGDGTAGAPFNNINDAKDHAEEMGIKEIVTYSEIVLNTNFKNFVIYGLAAPVVDTNGQDCSGSEFHHCTMRGTYTGNKPIVVQESVLDDGFQLTGFFENCVVVGEMNIIGGATVKNCSSGQAGLTTPSFNMNTGIASTLSIRDWSGGILIKNMDHVNDICTLEISQGRAFLDNTNTLGLISVRGLAFFDDQSAGTVVETSALLDPSKSQLTDEEQTQLFKALTKSQFIALK